MKPDTPVPTDADGAPGTIVEVCSREQLAEIAGIRPLRPFVGANRLRLRIPSIRCSLQEEAERRLNFWLGVCGCQAGALLFLGAFAWRISGPARAHASLLEAVLVEGGLILAAGLLGKAGALLFARAMIAAEVSWLLRRARGDARERALPV